MKKMIFIFLNLVLISCHKETPENKVIVDTVNWIILKNKAGDNLLDPNVPNHYENNKIYVFKLDSDRKEIVLQNNKVMSLPEMAYFISIVEYGIEDAKVNQTTVYLKLSQSEIDTINIEYKIDNGNLYNTKLWYNGVLRWTRENDIPIEIIKD
jgi:hypothetical protein